MNNLALAAAMISIQLHGAQVQLPNPLVTNAGQPVKTAEQWRQQRRPEVLEQFRTYVYGRNPVERPADLKWTVETVPNQLNNTATLKKVTLTFSGRGGPGKIEFNLFVPANANGASPCFVFINNRRPALTGADQTTPNEFWPAEYLIKRGYATAAVHVAQMDPDKHDEFKDGVHAIFDPAGERAPDAWATIGAWAWGLSRVMDYLETDSQIDKNRVAVVGHSRGGKTALWAAAQDERFAMAVSNNSGSTGAAIARGKKGETIQAINKTFPHWFNANYKKYDGRENELPVDQHELLALIAPRLLYVASATEDETADPAAEYASAVAATPVFELYGLKGLAGTRPEPGNDLHETQIGYHVRKGEHNLSLYDWERFVNYADKHLKAKVR